MVWLKRVGKIILDGYLSFLHHHEACSGSATMRRYITRVRPQSRRTLRRQAQQESTSLHFAALQSTNRAPPKHKNTTTAWNTRCTSVCHRHTVYFYAYTHTSTTISQNSPNHTPIISHDVHHHHHSHLGGPREDDFVNIGGGYQSRASVPKAGNGQAEVGVVPARLEHLAHDRRKVPVGITKNRETQQSEHKSE